MPRRNLRRAASPAWLPLWVAYSACVASPPVTALRGALSSADEHRIDALIDRMTLEEEAGQLTQLAAGQPTGPGTHREPLAISIASGRVGSLLNVTDARQANALQHIAVEKSRLGIPLLFADDVIHGFRTIYPIPLGLSASWDTRLVEELARQAARESAAQGVRWTFSPMVDIARDARWGRIAEGAGEDPLLGSAMATASVRGYQGVSLRDADSIVACAKHFVGYGAAEGGRDYNTTEISDRTLRQVYLPPFRAAVEAGVGTLMSAFNSLDEVPASADPFTLHDVLRSEWGFGGLVVSDWGSVEELEAHGIANDGVTAARKAFMAGVDVDMESSLYGPALPALVRSGALPKARVDEAVRRMLRLKLELGLLDHPYVAMSTGSDAEPLPAGPRDLARRAAEESFVLLENAPVHGAPLLPLAAVPGKTLALIGPMAGSAADMLGPWSAQGRPSDVITLHEALRKRCQKERLTLLYALGTGESEERALGEAVATAHQADVVILALGEPAWLTGEAASRIRLDLPREQERLMEAVAETGTPIVLVLFNGRPLTIRWAAEHVPAILEAWYPGVEAGPALVRTLFGDVNPSGHLTVTVPRTVGQEPLYYDALSTGRPAPPSLDLFHPPASGTERYVSRYIDELNAPLYPFGHGLSYTTFAFSPVTVDATTVSVHRLNEGRSRLNVSAEVTNTGNRAGAAIVQLYIRLRGTSVARPLRELKGFRRLDLAPGETRRVELELGRAELAFWNIDMKDVVEPALLDVWIAPDSVSGTPAEVTLSPD